MSYWDDLMYCGCNKRRHSSGPNTSPIETRRFKIRRSSSSSSSSCPRCNRRRSSSSSSSSSSRSNRRRSNSSRYNRGRR